MNTRVWPRTVFLIAFTFASVAAGCGDDSDNGAADAGGSGKGGNGGNGGSSGNSGAGGKSGDTGGSSSGSGGSGGKASAGSGGGDDQNMCTEEFPTQPTKCGGVTCVTPEFEYNPCVVPCCVQVNGQEKCGARSTSNMFPAACTLLAEPDPACPAVQGDDLPMDGCCDRTLGKCGIVSRARPGCITVSDVVTIPNNTCSKTSPNDTDAGEADAG